MLCPDWFEEGGIWWDKRYVIGPLPRDNVTPWQTETFIDWLIETLCWRRGRQHNLSQLVNLSQNSFYWLLCGPDIGVNSEPLWADIALAWWCSLHTNDNVLDADFLFGAFLSAAGWRGGWSQSRLVAGQWGPILTWRLTASPSPLPLLFLLLLHVAKVLLMTWYPGLPHPGSKIPSRKSWDWKFLIPLEPVYSTLKYAQIFYLAYLPVFGRIYALTYMSAHQIWISGVSLKRPSKVQFRHIVDLWSIWPSCQILWPNQVLTTIYTMTSMTTMTTVTTMTTITTMTTVDYYWQIPKLKSSHWGLVIYNQIVT